jgi:RNA polymerase sigma-70 factor (ECF subfamily)
VKSSGRSLSESRATVTPGNVFEILDLFAKRLPDRTISAIFGVQSSSPCGTGLMGTANMRDSSATISLLVQAGGGDQNAIAALFARHHDRLEQMVRLRMDRRLQGRIDPADVLQETFMEAVRRVGEFAREPSTSVYLWLRCLTAQKLIDLTRRHLGAKMRDAGQEISIYRGTMPQASSMSLAAQLLGRFTSPSQAVIRAETQLRVQEALNSMDPIDREVLALRHFELLSNGEVAEVLGLSKAAASNRYVRALKRMKQILSSVRAHPSHRVRTTKPEGPAR